MLLIPPVVFGGFETTGEETAAVPRFRGDLRFLLAGADFLLVVIEATSP